MNKTLMSQNDLELAQKRLSDPKWRMNNLYHIVNKKGSKTLFRFNWMQEALYDNMWYCNLILKARQLGCSTFVSLLFLDRCLFNDNVSAGIIAHTIEDAQQMFRRVKLAYDSLPENLKQLITADNDTSQMLKFSNGSSIRVGTSLRSSTFQYLHISEFGKLCSRYPEKAREVVTGSLNTLSTGQYCFIESTAEGRDGAFFDMVCRARALQESETKLTPLDFRFFFFPWWKCPEYQLQMSMPIPQETEKYFEELETKEIRLYPSQKFWYCKKQETQNTDMMREYPSTPDEAFHTSLQGAYYSRQMLDVRKEKRIGHIPHDPCTLVSTSFDLGYGDSTAIWFFQLCGKEIHLIEYYENSGEPLTFYLKLLQDRPYQYGRHLVPHDAGVHEYGTGQTRIEIARKLGVTFTQVPRISVDEGIDAVRHILRRCWFDESKCFSGIKALESYRRQWNETQGCWSSRPHHDQFSHGADSLRVMAVGLSRVEKSTEPVNARTLGYNELRAGGGSRFAGTTFIQNENINQDAFRGQQNSRNTSIF